MSAMVKYDGLQNTLEKLTRHLSTPVKDLGTVTFKEQAPRVVCVNGAVVSVQVSRTHYCSPRNDFGPWTHVELGYPSLCPPKAILEYAEEPDNPTGTVYAYVPIALVAAWINSCGGFAPLPDGPVVKAEWEVE